MGCWHMEKYEGTECVGFHVETKIAGSWVVNWGVFVAGGKGTALSQRGFCDGWFQLHLMNFLMGMGHPKGHLLQEGVGLQVIELVDWSEFGQIRPCFRRAVALAAIVEVVAVNGVTEYGWASSRSVR